MVKLTKIYTRTGDTGDTGLGDGSRVAKYDPRVEAYGTVDEVNASLGMARLHADGTLDDMLTVIQNDLFDLGADLCTPEREQADSDAPQALRITDSQVDKLEQEIDRLNADLATLRSFVLPGGSPLAATLHFSRTVARRGERLIAQLALEQTINPAALRYMNRLSDYLFVAARHANRDGAGDVLWVPGGDR